MDSLVGYGSDDENETERYGSHHSAVSVLEFLHILQHQLHLLIKF